MARMNEPPAAPASILSTTEVGESREDLLKGKPPADFEEVKRRFIKQNRDLAKSNSTQLLRIRSLELEVSRLLADNLDLRNQVLHLHHELYTTQTKTSSDAVQRLRSEFRAKIEEMNALLEAFEDAPTDILPEALKGRRPSGNWRERQPLSEVMRDSQMPTINENKLYPRRTLDLDELQPTRLSDQSSNESPDLGPPPIARFDCEDFLVKQASPSPVKHASPVSVTPTASVNEEDLLPASLAINLETRRKRKDGSSRLEIRRHSILPQSPAKTEGDQPASAILRTGAKRKLADRENDKPIKPPSKGDFTFSRKASSEETRSGIQKLAAIAQAENVATQSLSPKPARKILGDKSVNMSPRKVSTGPQKLEKGALENSNARKPSPGNDHGPGRRRRESSIPQPSPQRDAVVDTVEPLPQSEELNPASVETRSTTPVAPDLFSPTPSLPSARPEGRNDTPPPPDLSSLSISTDGGEARPSRRARGAVNYAEPSLTAKLRRPDKKLVDAISGLQDPRCAMNTSAGKKSSSAASSVSVPRNVTVKNEPVDDNEDWKHLPSTTQSPLEQKSHLPLGTQDQNCSPAENLVSVTADMAANAETVADGVRPSAASATISALISSSRKRRQSSQDTDPNGGDTVKRLEDLDIYEFKDSSSPDAESNAAPAINASRPKSTVRVRAHQRRHTTISKEPIDVGDQSRPSSGTSKDPPFGPTRTSRRQSMMM